MRIQPSSLALLLALFPLIAGSALASFPETETDSSEPPARSFFETIFLDGRLSFDLRLRYEWADQSELDASHAATARIRLGYQTKPDLPLSAAIEFEDIRALDGDAYNQAGLNNEPRKTVIADPETTELNQAFLHFHQADFTARLGRQRILLDNQRFVGNVGWRQNEQTFDALSLRYQFPEGPAFFYGYVDQVNRVFGREHPAGRWKSDSHLLHVRSPLAAFGEGGAYLFALQFKEAPGMSGDTAGVWFRPDLTWIPLPTTLHLEIARQSSNSSSPSGADFDPLYFRGELETTVDRFTFGGGFERLEGDGTTAFQTPLATLHAFNGWADQFLTTPPSGLDDLFVFTTIQLPARIKGRLEGHRFAAQRGSAIYGHELDLFVSKPIHSHVTVLAKAALFDGREGRPDATKFWLQTEVVF